MTQEELQQKIAEYYTKLPEDLKETFSSMKWMEDLKNIGAKYSLNDEQNQTVAIETTLVLLGIIELGEYANILKKELKLSEENTNKILEEIDNTILVNIKEKLDDTYLNNIEELAEKESGEQGNDAVPVPPYAKKQEVAIEKTEIKPETSIEIQSEELQAAKVTPPVKKFEIKEDNFREKIEKGSEEEIYGRTDIEMIKDEEVKIEPEVENKEITEKEKETMVSTGINMLEEKLGGATWSKKTVSDYSTPKSNDPYKEPIE